MSRPGTSEPLPEKIHICEGCANRRIPSHWRYCERCQAIKDAMGDSPTDGTDWS